jgi:hypothetical protein
VKRSPLKRTAWKRKSPDPEKAKAAQRKKQKRAREKHAADFGPHRDWVCARGCEVPNCPAEAHGHHEPARRMGGSKKPTAHRLAGLCADHHTDGAEARHRIGLARFNARFCVDLKAAAARNWAESPYGEKVHGHLV